MAVKRYAVLGAALSLAVALAGCAAQAGTDTTDPATFTTAIDEYLGAHPEPICSAPLFLPYDERVGGVATRALRDDELRWLDGLSAAGLLVKARTTAHGTTVSGPTPVDEYVLSATGARAIDAERTAGGGGPVRFCVADTRVGAILAVRVSATSRERTALVRYRPVLAKRAAWAASRRTRSAMQWLAKWTHDQLSERRVTLHRTPGGWIVL